MKALALLGWDHSMDYERFGLLKRWKKIEIEKIEELMSAYWELIIRERNDSERSGVVELFLWHHVVR